MSYNCDYCNIQYSSNSNRVRHMKKCPLRFQVANNLHLPNNIKFQVSGNCNLDLGNNIKFQVGNNLDLPNNREIKINKTTLNNREIKINKTTSNNREIKINKTIPAVIKKQVWDTYIGSSIGKIECPLCQNNEIQQLNFHCAHVTARSKGGSDQIENLRPICSICNQSISSYNLIDFAEKYYPDSPIHQTFQKTQINQNDLGPIITLLKELQMNQKHPEETILQSELLQMYRDKVCLLEKEKEQLKQSTNNH